MIVEWNEHMFSPDVERFPYQADAPYRPEMTGDPLDAYTAHMEEEGIDRAVIVQPCPYWDDHRLLLDCLEREPERLRGTCLYRPKDPDAPAKMAELVARQSRIVACRFHGEGDRKAEPVARFADGVLALWRKALDLGLMIELHINSKYAPATAATLAQMPETILLIDHLAEPHTTDAVDFAAVLDLAAFDNVYMKLSGLGHFADDGPLFLSARPFTARVIDAFGPNNLVWGSGTPRIVDAHMATYAAADRQLVKGGNLERLLKLS
jgi:predicted TIM-barrel fold metal-dependent hydrolase